ncbi:MAG TPA: nuclear transport factor 2 family protein [Streptosporangiaceae bacterium]|nr:nuclear transport factor 2 family protein [Streptosporangiaceae bacterium]
MTASMGTVTDTDTDTVRAVFQAFADADAAALDGLLHADATWNHRNSDRLGGVHHGTGAIMAYLAESAQLTDGTLRAVPQSYMADGGGRVGVLVRVRATRPDGRSMDGPQIVLFPLDGGRVRSIDQFVGDPAAVAAFWA